MKQRKPEPRPEDSEELRDWVREDVKSLDDYLRTKDNDELLGMMAVTRGEIVDRFGRDPDAFLLALRFGFLMAELAARNVDKKITRNPKLFEQFIPKKSCSPKSGSTAPITKDEGKQIIALHKSRLSYKAIAAEVRLSSGAIGRHVREHCDCEGCQRKRPSK